MACENDDWDDDDFVPPPEEDFPSAAGSPSLNREQSPAGEKSIFSLDTQCDFQRPEENDDGNGLGEILDFGDDDFFDENPTTSTQSEEKPPPPGREPPVSSPISHRAERHEQSRLRADFTGQAAARKFPGPAGIMPRLNSGTESRSGLAELLSKRSARELDSVEPKSDSLNLASEGRGVEELVHGNRAWQRMLEDRAAASTGGGDSQALLNQFNIGYVKRQMRASNADIKRSPLLVAALQTLNLSSTASDPTCQLLDPSGTISGMIHSDVMAHFGSRVQPGSVFVLANVTVLQTVRSHYVNITKKNVAGLYWNAVSGKGGRVPGVFAETVVRLDDEQVLNAARRLEVEERQAAQRAEALARQAAAAALREQRANNKQQQQPRFLAPRPPPPPAMGNGSYRPAIRPPQNRFGFRPPPPPPSCLQARNCSHAASSSSVNSSSASADETLEGLDEESLFGDF